MNKMEREYLDRVYPQEEFEKDLMHSDVVAAYQKELEQKFGRPVDYGDAEDVAYRLYGSKEEAIEKIRPKYTS